MEKKNFLVPANNKSEVEAKFAKFNKRAKKFNTPEISWNWGKAFLQKRNVQTNKGTIAKEVLILPLEVFAEFFVECNDWQFAATLQHLPTGENIVRSITDNIPTKFRETGSACDHCKVNRYRKDTYVLFNKKENSFIQVGSSCMQDFLGVHSPENIVGKANFISEVIYYLSGIESGFSNDSIFQYEIEKFLAQTSACIRKFGWASKSKAAENNKVPTVNLVISNLDGYKDFHCEVNDQDKSKAKSASDWVENLSDQDVEKSEYLYNIRAIVRSGMVEMKTSGYAASVISSYDRFLSSQEVKKESNFVGLPKERLDFKVTLKSFFSYSTAYGYTYKYIFKDEDGNAIVWAASSPQDFEQGKKYLIKGTVKSHSEYKSIKQTNIIRCEILAILEN